MSFVLHTLSDYWYNNSTFNYEPLATSITRRLFLEFTCFSITLTIEIYHTMMSQIYKLQILEPIPTYMNAKSVKHLYLVKKTKDQSIDETIVQFKECSFVKRNGLSRLPLRLFYNLFTEVVLLDVLRKILKHNDTE